MHASAPAPGTLARDYGRPCDSVPPLCSRLTSAHRCAQALIHNLNRHYYSINISYRKDELEQKMLLNLHKKT